MLVEMLHIPPPIGPAIEIQHALHLRRLDPLRRNPAQPAVNQTGFPFLIEPVAITPELTLRHPQQLRRLHHRQLPPFPAAQHIPKLLHPAVL
jgi:hypothetical protein